MTTDILIDVDGVINAVGHAVPQWGWPLGSQRQKRIMGFNICWSDALISELNAMSQEEDIEFFWLTTWLDEAVDQLVPNIGLTEGLKWPVLGHEPYRRENPFSRGKPGQPQNVNDWWKLDAAQEHFAARQNRFVWIDDDLRFSDSAVKWAESLPEGTAMLIAPESDRGISVDLLEEIKSWIKTPT